MLIQGEFISGIPENMNEHEDAKPAESTARKWVRLNRWFLAGAIAFMAVFTIFMVNNVRSVNSLLTDIGKLEDRKQILEDENKLIRSEILRLESADRIIPLAETKLKMKSAGRAPKKLK